MIWEPSSLAHAMEMIYNNYGSEEQFDESGLLDAEAIYSIVPSSARILDFGAGIGRVLKYLHNAIGYEPSMKMIEYGREWASGCTFVSSLSVISGSFDAIWTCHVLQHLTPDGILKAKNNFKSLLKNDGVILMKENLNPIFLSLFSEYNQYHVSGILVLRPR